jgi:glycosyltransferase involved in cell wall biosynthesis
VDLVVDGTVYENASYGGIARIYSEILPRMCVKDPTLQVALLTSGCPGGELPRHSRIRHVRIPAVERVLRPGRLWRRLAPRVSALARRAVVGEARGRIWHSTYYTRPLGWAGPFVVTAVDMIQERFPELFGRDGGEIRRRKRACLEAADAIVAISETTKKDIEEFYPRAAGRVRVVPLGCGRTFLRRGDLDGRSVGRAAERPFLLYVGIRSRYKNTDLLLRAYEAWRHRPEVELVVVGRPWSQAEQEELVALSIADRVHLLGYIDDEQLGALYRRAVALVYPSLYEGFGLPLLEAMASGCPVVASRIPSTVEVAGDCPIYFEPPGSVDTIVAALDAALMQGREPECLQRGHERADAYSWERTAQLTLDVYASLAAR